MPVKRSIYVYVIAALATCGVCYGLWQWQIGLRCDKFLAAGSDAIKDGDYVLATKTLGRRLRQTSCDVQDAATHYQFAYARVRVPEAESRHIVEAISALQKAVVLQPGMTEAWRDLTLAWVGTKRFDRAVMAARKLVALEPGNHDSQRLMITSLLATNQYKEVLEITGKELQKNEERWWLYLAQASAAHKKGEHESLKSARIAKLPEDERLLVDSYIAILEGDIDSAKAGFAGMAKTSNGAPLFLETTVNLLIGLDMQALALDMLGAQPATLAATMRKQFVELLLHAGRQEEALDYLRNYPANLSREPDLLLVGVISAAALDYPEEKLESLISSGGVSRSDTDRIWLDLLTSIAFPDSLSTRVEAAEKVLEIEPRNAAVLQILAESWLSLGEARRAEKLARLAMEEARSWVAPGLTRAEALMRTGRYEEAFQVASDLSRRFPDKPQVAFQLVRAWTAVLQDTNQTYPPSLANLIAELQQRTSVDLDAYLNTGQFIEMPLSSQSETLTGALKKPQVAHATASTPGMEISKYDTSQSTVNGIDPAIKQSIALKNDKFRDGTRCREISSGSASTCWLTLLDKYEDDLNVYVFALDWAASQNQPDLQDEIIDRLVDFTPTSSSLWRLARARALFTETHSEKSMAEAVLLLRHVLLRAPDQADAHLLMSVALAHLNDRNGMFSHLLSAVDADPRRATDALRISLYLLTIDMPISPREVILSWKSITSKEIRAVRESVNYRQRPEGNNPTIAAQKNQIMLARFRVLAAFAESYQQKQLAEAVYRQILRIDENQDFAANNLAMILSENKDALEEALALAVKATRLKPNNADYEDTLQLIQVARLSELDASQQEVPTS